MGKVNEMKNTFSLKWGEGNIVRKAGSTRLYFDFRYFGKRVEISTGLTDTVEHRKKALLRLLSFQKQNEIGHLLVQ